MLSPSSFSLLARPCLFALVLSLPCTPSLSHAGVSSSSLGSTSLTGASIAVDPQGNPHIAYQSSNYRLQHTWWEGKSRKSEQVDSQSDAGWGNSIAVDRQGRVHITYHAERTAPYRQVLVHAVKTGGSWKLTEVDAGGWSSALAIGPDGQPRVLYYGPGEQLVYARLEGGSWKTEATGLGGHSFMPNTLAFDAAGTAHASFSLNTQAYYAVRTAAGAWESTPLGIQSGEASLALDSAGKPHLAVVENQSVRHYWLQNGVWEREWIFDRTTEPLNAIADHFSLAIDGDDNLRLMGSAALPVRQVTVEIALYGYHDGLGWTGLPVSVRNAGFEVDLALDDHGVGHVVYRGVRKRRATLSYARVALAGLTGSWTSLQQSESRGSTSVKAVLTLHNSGPDASDSSSIAVYLSQDAVFDPGDTPVTFGKKRKTLRLGSVAAGQNKAVRVSFKSPGPAAGRYLIAVVDPDGLSGDADRTDNTIVIPLED